MSARLTVEEVLEQALTLDEKGRASVAGALIESLHERVDPEVEEAWDAEIERRVQEIDLGLVEMTPWSEVRKRLFRGLE
jgi:putative addiction module component (TIGR02574 family)